MGERAEAMIGIYFSGTGNTKYCVESYLKYLSQDGKAESFSIEDDGAAKAIMKHRDIVFGYPVYFSSLPKIVQEYITTHSELWKDKNVFIIATMGLFSGDGAGVPARLLKKYGAHVTGGLHLTMPDCICDEPVLKRTFEKNRKLMEAAREKSRLAAELTAEGKPPRMGLGPFSHLAGLLGQRLWFGHNTRNYTDKLTIDRDKCTGCRTCTKVCPMKNLTMEQGKAASLGRCTMCYRCANRCPAEAITLMGKRVIARHRIEEYVKASSFVQKV